MTGRHKFIPDQSRFQTEGEDLSSHDYAHQRRLHHEAALADWDKPEGLHKRDHETKHAVVITRNLAQAALASLRFPRHKH